MVAFKRGMLDGGFLVSFDGDYENHRTDTFTDTVLTYHTVSKRITVLIPSNRDAVLQ